MTLSKVVGDLQLGNRLADRGNPNKPPVRSIHGFVCSMLGKRWPKNLRTQMEVCLCFHPMGSQSVKNHPKKNKSKKKIWEKTHHSNLRTPWLTPDFYRFLLKSASFFDVYIYIFFSFLLKKTTQKNMCQQKKRFDEMFLGFFQKLKDFCFNVVLLMKEILYHLRCIKPCKWCRISSINSIFFWNKKVLGF